MPQVTGQHIVDTVNLKDDMNSYYRGTYVTHKGHCAYVHGFIGRNDNLRAEINYVNREGEHLDNKTVPVSELDLHLPDLGWVKYEDNWFHLSRNPQRRMRKGYGEDMIRFTSTHEYGNHCPVTHTSILVQVWYGNEDRVSNDCIIHNRNIHYYQDIVATIDEEGNVIPVIGKEKLGEFVCKLLASNWDILASKHSLRLPNL